MIVEQAQGNRVKAGSSDRDVLSEIQAAGLWQPGKPLRLHLGCGRRHFDGYVNIDYPPSQHNLIQVQADVYVDIKRLNFPCGSVDEIWLHHVFEHFNRVTALAMLIKWHQWLKIGGNLHIETPDLMGSAKTLVSNGSWRRKMAVVRHLVGDQAADWGYHIEQWFPERFVRTLRALGYASVQTLSTSWSKEPFLWNVQVAAVKDSHSSLQEQVTVADGLLWESTVSPKEKPTWEVWRSQLRAALAGDCLCGPGSMHTSASGQATKPTVADWISDGDIVFDVGAYLGSKTDTYLAKGARVVCFEPQPKCVRALREKYQNNRKVTIVDKGLADKSGQTRLLVCNSAPTISTFSRQWLTGRFADHLWDRAVPVQVTTLDETIRTYGCPKFCKIDVEGFEFEVLKGLSQRIPYLSFEFTIEFLENAKKCVTHLVDLGYKYFNVGLGENAELVFWEWVSPEALFHHIEHLNDKLLWGDIYAKASDPESIGVPEPVGDIVAATAGAQTSKVCSISGLPAVLSQKAKQLPLDEIHGFNRRTRDRWVQAKAKTVPAGSRVLDVGAGTCPYRSFFAHCDYKTQDFGKYEGIKKNGTTEYGRIDYVSDVSNIPVPDESFDVIVCTEVLEHVPEPIEALREVARILRADGRIFLTAPLGSGLHQLPYHYYGGYTPQWYRHFLPKFALQIKEIVPNGGFFKLLAQECARVKWTLPQHQHLHGNNVEFIQHLFGEWLPRYLFSLEEQCLIDQFTVGYHVEGKKNSSGGSVKNAEVVEER
jgi:FkbM family methyltransferase